MHFALDFHIFSTQTGPWLEGTVSWTARLPPFTAPVKLVKQETAERKVILLGRQLMPPWRAGSVSTPASKLFCELVSHISKSFHRSSCIFLISRAALEKC